MAKEYKGEEEIGGEEPFSVGYRAWKLGWQSEKKEPRLIGPGTGVPWEPDIELAEHPFGGLQPVTIVNSDWREDSDQPWEQTNQGLYMLREGLEKAKEGYPYADIYGEVIPFGKIREGPIGYRAQKAKVSKLYEKIIPCRVCGGSSQYFIHNSDSYAVCLNCLKRVEKIISNRGFSEEEVDRVLRRLADIYEAEFIERD